MPAYLHPADFTCPECGSVAGSPCRSGTGRTKTMFHAPRMDVEKLDRIERGEASAAAEKLTGDLFAAPAAEAKPAKAPGTCPLCDLPGRKSPWGDGYCGDHGCMVAEWNAMPPHTCTGTLSLSTCGVGRFNAAVWLTLPSGRQMVVKQDITGRLQGVERDRYIRAAVRWAPRTIADEAQAAPAAAVEEPELEELDEAAEVACLGAPRCHAAPAAGRRKAVPHVPACPLNPDHLPPGAPNRPSWADADDSDEYAARVNAEDEARLAAAEPEELEEQHPSADEQLEVQASHQAALAGRPEPLVLAPVAEGERTHFPEATPAFPPARPARNDGWGPVQADLFATQGHLALIP